MKIAIGSDHRGFKVKEQLISWLKEKNHEVIDVGTDSENTCDYPDFAAATARLLQSNTVERAILLCSTGVGMCITANKFPGVYAGVCQNPFEAERAREQNNINCMSIPANLSHATLTNTITNFLKTNFVGGRHERRFEKIRSIEDEFCA